MNRDVSWLFEKPIAHRGARFGDVPENSVPAFKEAVDRGLVIELDVHILRDGTVVVFHDFDTTRMTGFPAMLKTLNLKTVKKLKLRGGGSERIPTLKEVLDIVDGKVGLLIELKVMLAYKRLCDGVLECLKDYKGKVAIQGFSQRALAYIAKKSDYPRGVIGMNYRKAGFVGFYGYWLNRVRYFDKIDPDFINYNFLHIPSTTTKRFRSLNIPIIAWTIRNNKQFERAKSISDNVIVETKYFDKDFVSNYKKEKISE